jgi:hypothetical protein
MIKGDELVASPYRRAVLFGPSKNGGKTTLAVSACHGGKIGLILPYSPGIVTIPPGVDASKLYIQQYDFDSDVIDLKSDKWRRTEGPQRVLDDIDSIVNGFAKGGPIVIDKVEVPLPEVIVMDDGVLFHDYIVAWICKVNNIPDPADWKQWGKRTQMIISLLRRLMRLPCSTIFSTWETMDKNSEGKVTERWPDVGGKLDYRAVGLADAGLYCYSEKEGQQVRFKVRTKSNGVIQGCGVRGRFDLPEVVDVTININDPKTFSPWARIWGETVKG